MKCRYIMEKPGKKRHLFKEWSTFWEWTLVAVLPAFTLHMSGCAGEEPSLSMHHSHTNVLWLTMCNLRADHLGAYGYKHDISPAIDALAEKSVLFEQTLNSVPWRRPSVAAEITDLYPRILNIEEPTKGVGLCQGARRAVPLFRN